MWYREKYRALVIAGDTNYCLQDKEMRAQVSSLHDIFFEWKDLLSIDASQSFQRQTEFPVESFHSSLFISEWLPYVVVIVMSTLLDHFPSDAILPLSSSAFVQFTVFTRRCLSKILGQEIETRVLSSFPRSFILLEMQKHIHSQWKESSGREWAKEQRELQWGNWFEWNSSKC